MKGRNLDLTPIENLEKKKKTRMIKIITIVVSMCIHRGKYCLEILHSNFVSLGICIHIRRVGRYTWR